MYIMPIKIKTWFNWTMPKQIRQNSMKNMDETEMIVSMTMGREGDSSGLSLEPVSSTLSIVFDTTMEEF